MVGACEIECLHAVTGLDDGISARFQQIVEELHVELVVLNDHHSLWHRSFLAPLRRWRRFALPPR
ncbi:hypothetical protein D3C72_2403720 [compost metagenome]